MKYNPALDGLRALAVLAVLFFHTRVPGFAGGFIGVDVFFVLSGYLITRLLVENRPAIGTFYLRRFLRLTPPLALMLSAYVAVLPMLRPDWPHWRDALVAALYLSDYFNTAHPMHYVGHTWSLAVEEHFYLLWPLLLYRYRPGVKALLLAFALLTLWRCAQPAWQDFYFRFDTHASGLVLGCLIAQLPRDRIPAWPGLLGLALLAFVLRADTATAQWIGLTAAELCAAVAVIGRAPTWLKAPPLAYVGKLSYGIYLWHYPITVLLRDAGTHWWLTTSAALALSCALAALSYHTIEAVIRRPALHHNQAVVE